MTSLPNPMPKRTKPWAKKPQGPKPGAQLAPPPPPPRYVAGTWRPNAPGFPDTPRIPTTPKDQQK